MKRLMLLCGLVALIVCSSAAAGQQPKIRQVNVSIAAQSPSTVTFNITVSGSQLVPGSSYSFVSDNECWGASGDTVAHAQSSVTWPAGSDVGTVTYSTAGAVAGDRCQLLVWQSPQTVSDNSGVTRFYYTAG